MAFTYIMVIITNTTEAHNHVTSMFHIIRMIFARLKPGQEHGVSSGVKEAESGEKNVGSLC